MTGTIPGTAQPGKPIEAHAPPEPAGSRSRPAVLPRRTGRPPQAGLGWLAGAMAALAALAAAAAVVSWDAQYVMIARVRHAPAIAALEAGIPDAGAAVFAALGIALALHGRRALRPRTLNVGCVGLSIAMNALAAAPGWRDVAIWVMPAAVYALASDTLIGVSLGLVILMVCVLAGQAGLVACDVCATGVGHWSWAGCAGLAAGH